MKGCVLIVRFMAALLLTCMGSVSLYASTGMVSFVTVRTRAPSNPNPRIWYRVPCDYRAVPGHTWRTLVIFGGRNCGGSNEVSNAIGWTKWADDQYLRPNGLQYGQCCVRQLFTDLIIGWCCPRYSHNIHQFFLRE